MGYDDTPDAPPTAQVTSGGITFLPTLTYDTQPDGTINVGLNFDYVYVVCPEGCGVPVAPTYPDTLAQSIFGSSIEGTITSESVVPLASSPEPGTFLMLGAGLPGLGLGMKSSRSK